MSLNDYLKDRIGVVFLNIIALITLIIFLFSVGNNFEVIKTVAIVWISVLIIFITYEYKKRKVYFETLLKYIDNLDKKYLISEIIDIPPYIDAIPYYYLLKKASKSMRDEINNEKTKRIKYKEYIEQWVHEVKTPISLIKLIEENNRTTKSSAVLMQLEDIDRYVEQALFYARSEDVEKDYFIKEISLEECVNSVVTKNKQGFILNGIDIEISDIDKNIYCDIKWLEFILNQIIVNSIKYKNNENPMVKINSIDIKNGIQLIIEDNGIGIPQNEISRVFEKGFTGNKGRINSKSTGIGLYLCKKLCDKLGLLINIESKEKLYTKVIITFSKGSLCKF
ncbi:integral membrane sensor signal transduction histidine kinase [[Clostridium] sordellii]|uniref:sensor histidine kinase n=1 Tax=Paraclostridium sordellii TaxID=1505 RepID=UPI0005E15733|nr:sensor histidine kinase [Paeniclostridium sordellii]MBX9179472.1 HAMP domain-containing histidine kinase [Paeniclostridium sordellii]CEO12504.1 integral membrane sensor signal transduction histidine kinase [[Clostridium] sordellii] [Paeniclostridium sordellii]CEP83513.1 integral membrane sensor signal transduction histidine kinase [[Clostridium] sordellii] [Paeniclostridium sordellii]CEQ29731.1 integral membrane sensor signal transduction histidine kinase [[Clostridium] sordellii] [Paeniclos